MIFKGLNSSVTGNHPLYCFCIYRLYFSKDISGWLETYSGSTYSAVLMIIIILYFHWPQMKGGGRGWTFHSAVRHWLDLCVVRGQPCLAGFVEPDCGMWWMASCSMWVPRNPWASAKARRPNTLTATHLYAPHSMPEQTPCHTKEKCHTEEESQATLFSNLGSCSILQWTLPLCWECGD